MFNLKFYVLLQMMLGAAELYKESVCTDRTAVVTLEELLSLEHCKHTHTHA